MNANVDVKRDSDTIDCVDGSRFQVWGLRPQKLQSVEKKASVVQESKKTSILVLVLGIGLLFQGMRPGQRRLCACVRACVRACWYICDVWDERICI